MAVIFDLDGTLVDSPQGIVKAFLAVFKVMNKDGVDAAAVRATIGMPLAKAFGDLLTLSPDHPDVLVAMEQYQMLFREIVLPDAKSLIFPDVEEGLKSIKSRGIPMAVATNKAHKNAKALLKAVGLFDYFDVVVGSDQVTNQKPHPEMGFLVMNKLGITAEDAIMVGDTTHDMLMGKDSGMHTIAVTYGIHDANVLKVVEPHKIVDNFKAVLLHIDSLPCCQWI